MEIQKYQLLAVHILGHVEVEKLPVKQELSNTRKNTQGFI